MSPTQRTLAHLRKLGYLAAVVEVERASAVLLVLNHGKAVLVDCEDLSLFEGYRWRANRQRGQWAVTRTKWVGRKCTSERLSRVVTDAQPGEEVDHRNGDVFDNRRSNLRRCTHAQNIANSGPRRGGSSRFKGVHWEKRRGRWVSTIQHFDRVKYLGSFPDEIDAARAYDRAAVRLFGEFARLNLPL